MSERVVVAMSGGVDSSVAAALLHEQGYDVIGMTLQLYDHGAAVHRTGSCCAGQDIADARRVAETLGIPARIAVGDTVKGTSNNVRSGPTTAGRKLWC